MAEDLEARGTGSSRALRITFTSPPRRKLLLRAARARETGGEARRGAPLAAEYPADGGDRDRLGPQHYGYQELARDIMLEVAPGLRSVTPITRRGRRGDRFARPSLACLSGATWPTGHGDCGLDAADGPLGPWWSTCCGRRAGRCLPTVRAATLTRM